MTFIDFLSNGGFSKFIWMMILLACVICALVVVSIQIIHNQTPNIFLINIIIAALSHGLTIGGSIVTSPGTTKVKTNAPNATTTVTTGGTVGSPTLP